MSLITDALIIRENNTVGESDRFITALTRDRGLIHASVRGARKLKSRNGSATGLLCHSRLSLIEGREKYIVEDATPLHVFFEVRADLEKLALAQYFCELAGVLAPREEPAEEPLRLLLNALQFLADGTRPPVPVKAVTELRLLCGAGYTPSLAGCAACGSPEADGFVPPEGTLVCDRCRGGKTAVLLTPAAKAALRHIVTAPFERCFAFTLPPEDAAVLGRAAEQFLLAQLGRGFRTLSFYHSL